MPTKNLVIHAIECKVNSGGSNGHTIGALNTQVAAHAQVGAGSGVFLGPITDAIAAALSAAGALIESVVDVGAAIDEADSSPDDLYLNRSIKPRVSQVWPTDGPFTGMTSGQIVRPGLTIPFSDVVDINFWEHDIWNSPSDDFLGRLTVDALHAGGIRFQVIAAPAEGAIYVVVYSVEEIVASPLAIHAALLWYKHDGWHDGSNAWLGPLQLGTGWANFKSVFATSDGIIYAIQPDGKLLWFRQADYQNGTGGVQGPKHVGVGWQNFKSVFATSDGIIYAIQPDGKLLWYRQAGYSNGTGGFLGPTQVGTGWQNFKSVFATDDGIIYAIQPDGKLSWYRHTDYQNGLGGFAGPKQVGTGWQNFKSVFAAKNGTIYAIAPDGKLMWYRHQGWYNGAESWAGPKEVGTGWQGFKSAFATRYGIIYGINP